MYTDTVFVHIKDSFFKPHDTISLIHVITRNFLITDRDLWHVDDWLIWDVINYELYQKEMKLSRPKFWDKVYLFFSCNVPYST
jgi:hypothetical protein